MNKVKLIIEFQFFDSFEAFHNILSITDQTEVADEVRGIQQISN